MKDNFGGARRHGNRSAAQRRLPPAAPAAPPPAGQLFDIWMILDLLLRRWPWLALGGMICGMAVFSAARHLIKHKFTATAQLLRYETPSASDFFKTTPLSAETFSGLLLAPDLLTRVGTNARPPLPPERLLKSIKIDPEPDSDLVKVMLSADRAEEAVELVNSFTEEAVKYTTALQAKQAGRVANDYLKQQVTQMDEDIGFLHKQFRHLNLPPEVTNKVAEIGKGLSELNHNLAVPQTPSVLVTKLSDKLQTDLADLSELTAKYTDLHPLVKDKRAQIRAVEDQLASARTNSTFTAATVVANSAAPAAARPVEFNPELDIIRTKLLSLEEGRVQLATRQREADLYATNPPGICRVFAPASMKTVASNWRRAKICAAGVVGGCFGMVFSLLIVFLVEFADNRLKTPADVARVTQLPVLTSLGNLKTMKPEEKSLWAFRTWTMLQGYLSRSPNHGFICGVTSSLPGEGRSTWIKLLAEAAGMTGFKVLTIATKPAPTHVVTKPASEEESIDLPDAAAPAPSPVTKEPDHHPEPNSALPVHTRKDDVLAFISRMTEQLTAPNSTPVAHILLPGWVWRRESRMEWRDALQQWRNIANLVVFVDLPPASVEEAVLLGCNMPNMLWLTNCGSAHAGETRKQIETLRHADCNLIGAVLNRRVAHSLRERFPRWFSCGLALAALTVAQARAQQGASSAQPGVAPGLVEPAPSVRPAATNLSFSIVNPSQRGDWQRHLTLGPGDVLTLGLYGQPEVQRPEVAVGPDGRVSFLEAQDVPATGLTIDEFRARLDEELGKYRRSPRSIVTPVAFRSKKYFLLGKVMTKGVYLLDRPMTVLEAIARARGLENGLVDRNVIDLADFQHAFLVRHGKRFGLNFEQLFRQGDLSQNIAIEPDDYIYIPGANIKEVYVVGEVRLPGPVPWNPSLTVIGALAERGGFTERGFKSRVLVVRGSLSQPETFVVDTRAILDAKGFDFHLQPRDIIYVSSRPFAEVEELADLAATAFIQSIITSWVGVDVIKPAQ